MPISTSDLRARALEVGFSGIGVMNPKKVPELARRLESFVGDGRHGTMGWMAERMGWRGDPSALWPEAKSVIMLAESYAPDHDPLDSLDKQDTGAISVYAQGRDYHDIVKKRLKKLGRWLIGQVGGEIKVFVDTAPVMEKPLAAKAGLGWQGKHTNLVSRELGSWFFLGAIFTTHEFACDAEGDDHCGSCRACLDICPTNAFPAPYQLDARLCISYLTIEHKGPVAEHLRPMLGNRIYGCDDCLAVCPWNKFARAAADLRYHGDGSLVAPDLAEFAGMDDAAFRARFSGSPIKRLGRTRFLRNVAYAMGNSGNRAFIADLDKLAAESDPVLANAARWARGRLSGKAN